MPKITYFPERTARWNFLRSHLGLELRTSSSSVFCSCASFILQKNLPWLFHLCRLNPSADNCCTPQKIFRSSSAQRSMFNLIWLSVRTFMLCCWPIHLAHFRSGYSAWQNSLQITSILCNVKKFLHFCCTTHSNQQIFLELPFPWTNSIWSYNWIALHNISFWSFDGYNDASRPW